MARGRHEKMSGIFDIFRRKKKEIEERALSLPERPALPAVPTPPEAPRLPGFLRFFRGMIPAPPPREPGPGPLAFFREAIPAPPALPPEAPTLPAPVEPVAPPGPPVVWEALFGPPEAEESVISPFAPPGGLAPWVAWVALPPVALPPAPPPPAAPIVLPGTAPPPSVERPRYTFIRVPRVEEGWRFPTVQELVDHLRSRFVKMDQMFEDLRELRKQPEFQKTVAVSSVEGRPVLVRVDPVVTKETYTDLASLFNIPWNVIESYFEGARTEADQRRADQAFFENLIEPLTEELTAAFEIMKPADLPGWFTVDFDDETETWYLFYVETAPEPRPGLPSQGGSRE